MRKAIMTVAAVVAAVAGVIAVVPGFLDKRASVTASGEDSIAAGNDVKISEETITNKHDFTQDRTDDAARYLSVARGACAKLVDRIDAITFETPFDVTSITQLYPQEMHPPEQVAEQYGERVRSDITARLASNQQLGMTAVKPLIANSIGTMTGRAPDTSQRPAFERDKKAWLDSTNDLCGYLRKLRT